MDRLDVAALTGTLCSAEFDETVVCEHRDPPTGPVAGAPSHGRPLYRRRVVGTFSQAARLVALARQLPRIPRRQRLHRTRLLAHFARSFLVRAPSIPDAAGGLTAMNDIPILLIYAPSLQSSDGTTVQLRRLLAEFPTPVWHIHGYSPPAFADLPGNCASLPILLEPRYPFRKGAGFVRRAWRRWWVPRFVCSRLAQATRVHRAPPPQVAYVVVYDELHAVFARAVLGAAGVDRYVLHMMDLFHARFDARAQPNLAKLIAGASGVFAVSSRLADEIAPAARQPVEVLPLVTGFVRPSATSSVRTAPYLMMSGALYAGDPHRLDFLRNALLPAWLELVKEIPGIEWLYSGADAGSLPPPLRAVIKNCGLLDQATWCATLAGARCTVFPIIHHDGDHYRYSVPSRLVDSLAAGVPVIAPSCPNTATGDFLDAFSNRGVIVATTPEEVQVQLKRLFCDDDFHRRQVIAALSAAEGFSLKPTQRQLFEAIQRVEA